MSRNRQRGSSIVEAAVSMVIIIPIVIMILFVGMEASQAYLIKEALTQGAREAARNLSVAYGQDSNIQFDRAQQDALVFNNIRMASIINASAQFDNPVWNPNSSPPTVAVTVHYTSGQNGLPVFPNPDPLNLGPRFQVNGSSTYRLE